MRFEEKEGAPFPFSTPFIPYITLDSIIIFGKVKDNTKQSRINYF